MMVAAVHACGCSALAPCPVAARLFAANNHTCLMTHLGASCGFNPKRTSMADVPTAEHPDWRRECAPLWDYLTTARTWQEIEDWRLGRGEEAKKARGRFDIRAQIPMLLVHNMIAWLHMRGAIECVELYPPKHPNRVEPERVRWVATVAKEKAA